VIKPLQILVVLSATWLAGAWAAQAAELEDLVKNSDLVVVGEVTRVQEGELDPALLKMNIQFRTDVATVAVLEVLKGDPALARVEIGFPGFPKPGEPSLVRGQRGIWLLTKSDRTYYEAKTAGRVLPMEQLAVVRRAVRAASGMAKEPARPLDRAARIGQLIQTLGNADGENVRRLAAYQLGEFGELSAVPALIAALNDESQDVRLAAELALSKITGYRSQISFQSAPPDERARGIKEWEAWWAANSNKTREKILLEAVESATQPQPNTRQALEGLAQMDAPALVPLFTGELEQAAASEDNARAATAATYLGRVKNRAAAPKLVALIDGSLPWTSTGTQSAAVAAIGLIGGQDFGTDPEAVGKCLAWWRAHQGEFK